MLKAALAIAMVSTSGCDETGTFHAKCDTLALTTELDYRLEFDVDPDDISNFNNAFVAYLKKEGFTYQTERDTTYLSLPDKHGKQTEFVNIYTMGCNLPSIISSNNVTTERRFIVTIHSSVFGNSKISTRIAKDLKMIITSEAKKPIKITMTKVR